MSRTFELDPASTAGGGPASAGDTWGTTTPAAEPSTAPSAPSEPRYAEVTEELGEGGLGRVLLVRDGVLGRAVAVKELRRTVRDDSPQGLRFRREAMLTAQLEHPGIVPLYDFGVRPDGTQFYVMRRIPGQTLGEAVARAAGLAERLALCGHFVDLCDALAYAHARGVIHRDLKPANVMVGSFGETVVLDWGLARRLAESEPSGAGAAEPGDARSGGTVAGSVLGTPAYMSPEQAGGRTAEIDPRSDVWSLGAVLFEIVSGRTPFVGATVEDVLEQARTLPAPPLRSVCRDAPPELCAIVDHALARDPGARYPGAGPLGADVEAWRTGRPVSVYRYSVSERAARWLARHRALVGLSGAALAALLVVVAVGLVRVSAERDRALAAEQDVRTQMDAVERNLALAYQAAAERSRETGELLASRIYAAAALSLIETPTMRGAWLMGAEGLPELLEVVPASEGCWHADAGPDGGLACGGKERVWVLGPGGSLRFERAGFRWVQDVRFLPDGSLAVLWSNALEVLDATGAVRWTRALPMIAEPRMVVLPDRIWLAAPRAPGEWGLTTLDPATGAPLAEREVVLTYDVAPLSDDRFVIWNGLGVFVYEGGERRQVYSGACVSGDLDPAGGRLGCGDLSGRVTLVDLDTQRTLEVPARTAAVWSMDWSPDGRWILAGGGAGGGGGQVAIVDPERGERLGAVTTTLGANAVGRFVGDQVLVTDHLASARRFGLATPPAVPPVAEAGIAYVDGRVEAFALADEVRWRRALADHHAAVALPAASPFRPDVVLPEGAVAHRDLGGGVLFSFESSRVLRCDAAGAGCVERPIAGKGVSVMVPSPDGRLVAVAHHSMQIGVYRADDFSLASLLVGSGGDVTSLAWSADGRLLASGGLDAVARLWDVVSGVPLAALRHPTLAAPVTNVALAPAGTHLALRWGNGEWREVDLADLSTPGSALLARAEQQAGQWLDGMELRVGTRPVDAR